MSAQPLNAGLDEYVEKLLSRLDNASAVLVTDREGVLLSHAQSSGKPINAEEALSISVSTITEQASKCGLGKGGPVVAFYENLTIVHLPLLPVVVTVVGSDILNVGLVLSIRTELAQALDSLRNAVQTVDNDMNL